jgi:hypothetical protein
MGLRPAGSCLVALLLTLPGCSSDGNDGEIQEASSTTSQVNEDQDSHGEGGSSSVTSCSDPIGDLTVDGNLADDRGGLDLTDVTLLKDGNVLVAELSLAAAPATAIVGPTDSAIWYLNVTMDPGDTGFQLQAGLSEDGPAFDVVDLSTLQYSKMTGRIEEDRVRLELPQDVLDQLPDSFFWQAGTEGNPEDGSQYEDGCPGSSGPPEKYLRFQP